MRKIQNSQEKHERETNTGGRTQISDGAHHDRQKDFQITTSMINSEGPALLEQEMMDIIACILDNDAFEFFNVSNKK